MELDCFNASIKIWIELILEKNPAPIGEVQIDTVVINGMPGDRHFIGKDAFGQLQNII